MPGFVFHAPCWPPGSRRQDRLLPDNPKFIKVAPTALSAKGLLEGEDHTGNIVSVPDRAKDPVGKSVRRWKSPQVELSFSFCSTAAKPGWSAEPHPGLKPTPLPTFLRNLSLGQHQDRWGSPSTHP